MRRNGMVSLGLRLAATLALGLFARAAAQEPPAMEFVGKLGPGAAKENSGMVKSRHYEDLYWTINDSGDEPRVYPIRGDGSVWGSDRYSDQTGVYIGGAINVDWEDIAVDDAGHIIVCDVGNNRNDRRDLALYYIDEPSPLAGRTTVKRKVFFRYPDQTSIPAPVEDFNYDCEGVFFAGGKVYLVTKNRSDSYTKLYRLNDYEQGVTNALQLIGRFDVGGRATAADATEDGRRLAIATYGGLWVFETEGRADDYFSSNVYWRPFTSEQVEAVCFESEESVLLADEQSAKIFRIRLDEMEKVDMAVVRR